MSKVKKLNSKFLRSAEIDREMDNVTPIKGRKRKPQNSNTGQLTLKEINPLTENQKRAFESYWNGRELILSGFPGTGKTFLAMYLALSDLFYSDNDYERIIICRSLVKSREIGHLPGSVDEKAQPFEAPYISICNELFNRGDAYSILSKKDIIQFENTSFLRGLSFNNALIIIDEAQNFNFHEIDTVCGRIGKNCRIIFSGDINQSDLVNTKEASGFSKFLKIANMMNRFDIVEFEVTDIVRSQFVYDYIVAKHRIEQGYN